MAKPNDQFGKRRCDMETKVKEEEKRLRKLEVAAAPVPQEAGGAAQSAPANSEQ